MDKQHDVDQQIQCLEHSGNLWNSILKISKEDMHPDDENDLRHHIHAIQNILYTQLYIKKHGRI